ncbi:MAG TPA: hypothetical protein VHD91_02350 [Gaiellaceae bacterium]|nr:hypothetical protein [Gaiellaceae bacterium]
MALSETTALSAPEALGILAAGQVVFWLAHVHGESLGRRAAGEDAGFRATAVEQTPILEAAVPAAAAICLWWIGVLTENAAYWLAVGLGVAELLAIGYTAGRRTGRTRGGAVGTALLDGALGGAIAVVKALV